MSNYAVDTISRYKANHKVYAFSLVVLLLLPPIAVFSSYIFLGESLVEPEPSNSAMTAVVNYVTMALLATSTFLLSRKAIGDIQKCVDVIDALQEELAAYKSENSELLSKLAESERKRKEAEALAERYWEMLSDEQRRLAVSIEEMLELNSPQHTSGRPQDASGRLQQQEYPHNE